MDLTTLFGLFVLVLSIIVHEVSHGYAANWLGDPTARLEGRLTLNPIPHIDLIGSIILPGILMLSHSSFMLGWAKPVPFNPYNLKNKRWGEAIVAGAGPAINLLLAVVFGLLIRFGSGSDLLSGSTLEFAGMVVYINLLLAGFNLIPFPPLDGSKILKSILPYRFAVSFGRFEAQLAQYGFLFLFAFLFVGMYVIWPVLYSIIGFMFGLITGVTF